MDPLKPELTAKLQSIADTKNVAIISFVAPQEALRTSPISFVSAAIEEHDMYRLEEIVTEIKSLQSPPQVLNMIIQTPGGELFTSYKIAQYLRSSFTEIKAFVPYQATSGGTLICCAANEIYMGDLGNLTPIDPQVRHKDTRLSAYAFERSVETIRNLFGEYSPREVPTPWQQMADKIDPVIYDEMHALMFTTYLYAYRLLSQSGYERDKAIDIGWRLAHPQTSHAHPFFKKDALEMGFNIKDDNDTIKIYSELVSVRSKEKSAEHIIDHFVPKPAPET